MGGGGGCWGAAAGGWSGSGAMHSSDPGDLQAFGPFPWFTVLKSQAVGSTGYACAGAVIVSNPSALIAVAAAITCDLFMLIRRNIGIPSA
jgi:hypothetical protein